MCTPRYLDIPSKEINALTDDDGTRIRVIAGDYRGYKGLVDGIDTDPSYLDITLMPNVEDFHLRYIDKASPIFLKDLLILVIHQLLLE